MVGARRASGSALRASHPRVKGSQGCDHARDFGVIKGARQPLAAMAVLAVLPFLAPAAALALLVAEMGLDALGFNLLSASPGGSRSVIWH